ncbi:MAG TPA: hypothetical protein VNQ78_02590 [Paracoccus sp. (in: a-proteobacteria)]|uniref:hypothetical protein n=1 Tax=Paracoccus sp. TaxID=267 RepID=UPI002B585648|nr:hypothetical protein [Paracoccus sp. (in: a-proteobacteria)]HWL55544.1 hypothetical protein [Paracoccus sp. (in: a-proteobacteria)]
MRKLATLGMLASALTLAACAENTGWNPNYSAINNGSGYSKYLREREAALHGTGPVPQAIPIQLPAHAPSVLDVGGTPTSTTPAKVQIGTVATAKPSGGKPSGAMPVTTSGPYAGTTPVLVRYAYEQKQNPGNTIYKRTGGSVAQAARICSTYPSTDAAQRGFIAQGGPLIDPKGMDPDGDGYVCGWDPRPVRQQNGL